MLGTLGPAVASFFLCLLTVIALRPVAVAVNLVDRPNGRKAHSGNVPIVGGLAMFVGVVIGTGLLPGPTPSALSFLSACALLVTVGLLDDRYDLSPWVRLAAQIAAAVILIGSGLVVATLGNPFGIGAIELSSYTSYGITVLVTIGAINAFNMLDGLDGLAGGMAVIALAGIAYLAGSAGLPATTTAAVMFIGAIVGFLVFNFPTRHNRQLRCFMGDAGSTLLGFVVAALCLRVSQGGDAAAAPVTMLWLVALPLYELVWTTLRRMLRGVSPFRGDRKHFHHLLHDAGFGVRGSFGIIGSLAALLATCGIIAERAGLSEASSLMLLSVTGVGVVILMYRAKLLSRLVPRSLQALPRLDQPTCVMVLAANEEPAQDRLAA